MKNILAALFAISVIVFTSGAFALSITDSELSGLSFTYTSDSLTDTSGGNTYKTFGMGQAISGGFLYVVVQTNFPEAGAMGNDSYTSMTHISPGDLYLNVGGTFQTHDGSAYGIGTTDHGNVVQQAYAGEVWDSISAGKLYSNADFATGTYERYQHNTPSFDPGDGEGNNKINSYPTLLRHGTLAAGDVSGTRYRANGASDPWDFDIFYKVSLAALGLTGGESLQAFWVMECGNDGAQTLFSNPAVPEPTTVGLLGAGLSALLFKRRRLV
jgi:hypothetical protein